VDAKGGCSCRLYASDAGRFLRKSGQQKASFRDVFADVIRDGVEFVPPYQPDLMVTETQGLPADIVQAASRAVNRSDEVVAERLEAGS